MSDPNPAGNALPGESGLTLFEDIDLVGSVRVRLLVDLIAIAKRLSDQGGEVRGV